MSDRMTRKEFLSYLRDGAYALSLSYPEQFHRYGASEFTTEGLLEDWSGGIEYLRFVGPITIRQQELVNAIEAILNSVDDPNSSFWENEALSSDARWEQIRAEARLLLKEFGWLQG